MYRTLRRLQSEGVVHQSDSFLVVFGGVFDQQILDLLDYENITMSSINPNSYGGDSRIDQSVNASSLPYADAQFDHVVAHAGLHHASRPHAAVYEMYRVASKSIMFFEAQDSLLMRLATKAGLVAAYEWNAIFDWGMTTGGVDGTTIPNYVYRWTRREVEKLVRSLDAGHEPDIRILREWNFYYKRIARRLQGTPAGRLPEPILGGTSWCAVKLLNLLLPWQGNGFAALILKATRTPHPWIRVAGGEVTFVPESVRAPQNFPTSRRDA